MLPLQRLLLISPRPRSTRRCSSSVPVCAEDDVSPAPASAPSPRSGATSCGIRTTRSPELMATGPNRVWSWDITKLKGPIKWAYFHLYVTFDIFSRNVVGWMVTARRSARLAERLIEETCSSGHIEPGQLTIHADRGVAMTGQPPSRSSSRTSASMEATVGPTSATTIPSRSPHFRTIKYRPEFPDRFGSLEHARQVCRALFTSSNADAAHSGLAFLTPAAVHHGRAGRSLTPDTAHSSPPRRSPRALRRRPRGAKVFQRGIDDPPQRKRRTTMPQEPRKPTRTTQRSSPFARKTRTSRPDPR